MTSDILELSVPVLLRGDIEEISTIEPHCSSLGTLLASSVSSLKLLSP